MVSKRLKKIRRKLKEKARVKNTPQIVTTPTNDMLSAIAYRSLSDPVNVESGNRMTRKKLRNMKGKLVSETTDGSGRGGLGINASVNGAGMISRLGYLMSNGQQNDMLNQRIQSLQRNIDDKSFELVKKNEIAALEEKKRQIEQEAKDNERARKYEQKIKTLEDQIKTSGGDLEYKKNFDRKMQELENARDELKKMNIDFERAKAERAKEREMYELQIKIECQKRDEEKQRLLSDAYDRFSVMQTQIDDMREENKRKDEELKLAHQTHEKNMSLIIEENKQQSLRIKEMHDPMIQALKESNMMKSRENELLELNRKSEDEIKRLTHELEISKTKIDNEKRVEEKRREYEDVKHKGEMDKLKRDADDIINRTDKEIAKLDVKQRMEEEKAMMEDMRNPQTAAEEIELEKSKFAHDQAKKSTDLMRENRMMTAKRDAHLKGLGLENEINEIISKREKTAGVFGQDYTNTLTPDESLALTNKELTRRELEKRKLEENFTVLNSITDVTNQSAALKGKMKGAKHYINEVFGDVLEKNFGERYRGIKRAKVYDEEYAKILAEKGQKYNAELNEYANLEYTREKELLWNKHRSMTPENFETKFGEDLSIKRQDAYNLKHAELEAKMRKEAMEKGDERLKGMKAKIRPEYANEFLALIDRKHADLLTKDKYLREAAGIFEESNRLKSHMASVVKLNTEDDNLLTVVQAKTDEWRNDSEIIESVAEKMDESIKQLREAQRREAAVDYAINNDPGMAMVKSIIERDGKSVSETPTYIKRKVLMENAAYNLNDALTLENTHDVTMQSVGLANVAHGIKQRIYQPESYTIEDLREAANRSIYMNIM